MTLLLVGDVDQTLMRFAGAYPELLNGEIDKLIPDIETIKLTKNYRSTQSIINHCQTLIKNNYSDFGGPYKQDFMKDVEWSDNAEIGKPVSFAQYSDATEETRGLVESVQLLLSENYEPGDIFVGARTKAQLGYLEGELVRAKIPFINITGGSFWNSKHVQDVISYVKLAYNNSDKDAFKRVYNMSSNYFEQPFNTKNKRKGEYNNHRWLAGKGLFLRATQESYTNLHKATWDKNYWRWEPGIDDLKYMIDTINHALAQGGIALALQVVINECYQAWLQDDEGLTLEDGGNSKLDDLQTVIEVAGQIGDTQEFFDYVDNAVKTAEDAKNNDWSDYVILSTIHRLKGLERKVVFGVGLSEGSNPETMEPGGLLPHSYSLTSPPQFGVLPTGGKAKIEDERCLAYVLVSRAEELVFLSGVGIYRKLVMDRSRFVSEMGV
jgi:DNA helicase-2/ATP-dependent DNA helicase PcrA